MSVTWEMHYDRSVTKEFLDLFVEGAVMASLVEYAKYAPYPVDLQMRRDAKTEAQHASLYVGLTDVLTIELRNKGQVRLKPHAKITTGQAALPRELQKSVTRERLRRAWSSVEQYLDVVIPLAAAKHATKEGSVQSAACTFVNEHRAMLDREATMQFRDTRTRQRIMAEITAPVLDVVRSVRGIPGKRPSSFGGECDLLGVDQQGNLLAVEIKPADVGSIRWAAAQATVYAEIFRRWIHAEDLPESPQDVLTRMLNQRCDLRLIGRNRPNVPARPTVKPIVALPSVCRQDLVDDLCKVRDALSDACLPSVDVQRLTLAGRPVVP